MARNYPGLLIVILLAASATARPADDTAANSASPADLMSQASEAFRHGRFDTAAEKYQAVLQKQPASGEAYAGLARTYLRQEKIDSAFTIATQGIEKVPASSATHAAMGEVYFRQGRVEESEKEFLAGIKSSPPDPHAFLGLTRLYDAYSLHAHARTMLERAHTLAPDDPDVRRYWMRTLSSKEQIAWLEKWLADSSNLDEDAKSNLQERLDLLKLRASRPDINCQLASKVTSAEAPLKPLLIDPKHLHGYGLMVKINGQSSNLLLDTGASGILINSKLAQKAGVQRLRATSFYGIGDKGEASGYLGMADSISVGGLEFRHCVVEVSDKRSVADDEGLIGANVFSNYLVTIDFLWQKLKLDPLPVRPGEKSAPASLASKSEDDADNSPEDSKTAEGDGDKEKTGATAAAPQPVRPGPQDRYIAPEMQDYTRIFRFGHQLLIPTQVGKTTPKLFLIDTGAMLNSISPQAAREVTKIYGDDRMHVKGVSGYVRDVYSADKAVLTFSRYRQENQDLTTFDLSNISRGTGVEVSGILGFTTLRLFTLKIDYRDGLVDFVYNKPK